MSPPHPDHIILHAPSSAPRQPSHRAHPSPVVNCVLFCFVSRCAVVGALFRKSTDLSVGAKSTYSSGEIVNMMSTDASRAQNLVSCVFTCTTLLLLRFPQCASVLPFTHTVRCDRRQVNYLFFTPLSFVFALYLLIWNVGPAAYAAVRHTQSASSAVPAAALYLAISPVHVFPPALLPALPISNGRRPPPSPNNFQGPCSAVRSEVSIFLQLVMIVVVIPPLMTFWTKTSQKIYKAKMKMSDQRAKSITEIMNSSE